MTDSWGTVHYNLQERTMFAVLEVKFNYKHKYRYWSYGFLVQASIWLSFGYIKIKSMLLKE